MGEVVEFVPPDQVADGSGIDEHHRSGHERRGLFPLQLGGAARRINAFTLKKRSLLNLVAMEM